MVVSKQALSEAYLSLTQAWGMTLSFSITQSLDLSEKTLSEAVVALIATELKSEMKRFTSTARAELFAKTICEMSLPLAFRGYTTESFYRMAPSARAAVILKIKGGFTLSKIAKILSISETRADEFLENARLLFSSGTPWLETSTSMAVDGNSWGPQCPQQVTSPQQVSTDERSDLQGTFARYLGADLEQEESRKLQDHLVVCEGCRKNFSYFKRRYGEWQSSLPQIDLQPIQQKHLKKVSRMAFSVDRSIPNPWAGVRAIFRETQVRTFLLSALFFMLLFQFIFRSR